VHVFVHLCIKHINKFRVLYHKSYIDDKNEKDSTKTIDNSKLKKAQEYYNKAIEAQKNGDWTKYGENINELGNILNSIK